MKMKLLQLFITASIPVLKTLLITALGSYLATERVNILGEDTRKHLNSVCIPGYFFFLHFSYWSNEVNWWLVLYIIGFIDEQVAFFVFNPALVGSSLAETITYDSMIKLWVEESFV